MAAAIVAALPAAPFVERVEVAGPGFINLFVADDWLHDVLRDVVDQRSAASAGRSRAGARVQVEFVSANPTGPLHDRTRAQRRASATRSPACWTPPAGRVEREYYFNDAGGQMDLFGASVEARYLSSLGRDAEVPEDGYHGAYIVDIAADILASRGAGSPTSRPTSASRGCARRARARVMEVDPAHPRPVRRHVRRVLLRAAAGGARRDRRRRSSACASAGHAYEADGAVWFRCHRVRRRQGSTG